MRAEEYRELDAERVLVLYSFSGRGKSSGLDVGSTWTKGAVLIHARSGRVTRFVLHFDRDRALGLKTDESQGVWKIFLLCERVAVGAGDDELKRRVRD
jgi:hypothetical protein